MEVILLISVLLLDVRSVSCEPLRRSEDSKESDNTLHLRNRRVSLDYKPLGCYDLQTLRNQSVLSRRKRFAATVKECSQKALKANFFLFGVKRGKRNRRLCCLRGNEKAWDRKDNFTNVNSCEQNIGSVNSIFMYRKTKGNKRHCTHNNKSYSDYDQIDIYNVTDRNNYFCTSCTCMKGKFRDCLSQSCSLGLCSRDEAYFPPDACCPWCKPPSGFEACNLKGLKPGDQFEEDHPEGTFRYHCFCYTGNYVNCGKSAMSRRHKTTKA